MAYVSYTPCRECGAERTAYDVVRGGGVRCYPCRLARAIELCANAPQPAAKAERRTGVRDTSRQDRMVELYRAGYTLSDIGVVFAVTRERVRQILKKAGVVGRDGGIAAQSAKRRQEKAARRRAANDLKVAEAFGCTWGELLACNDGLRPFVRNSRAARFFHQRRNAMRRDIPWLMSFPEWAAIWEASGKWDQRGCRGDLYVMARKQDFGPYAAWNVYITTLRQNVIDYQAELKRRGVKCADGYRRLPERAHSPNPPHNHPPVHPASGNNTSANPDQDGHVLRGGSH